MSDIRSFPSFRALRERDEKAGDEIGAVVQEVIFLERRVAARLDGERGVLSRRVQALALVDDVLVSRA